MGDRPSRMASLVDTTPARVDLFAMKTSVVFLLFAAFSALSLAQSEPGPSLDQVTSKQFLQQLIQDDVYLFIAPKVAEPYKL
jgi:hypothetical protein